MVLMNAMRLCDNANVSKPSNRVAIEKDVDASQSLVLAWTISNRYSAPCSKRSFRRASCSTLFTGDDPFHHDH
jgi:hypothetical protein